jgi:hypothetical protein
MSVLHFTLSIGTSALELPRTILLACNLVAEVATLTRSRQATNSVPGHLGDGTPRRGEEEDVNADESDQRASSDKVIYAKWLDIESGIDAHTINAVRKYITAFA